MAIKSFGVTVEIDGTTIGELVTADISGGDVTTFDTTTHQSPDGCREFEGGLKDNGSLEMTFKYKIADAGQIKLRAPAIQGTKVEAILTASDGSTSTFDVIVGVPSAAYPLDEDVVSSCSCKISGKITYAAAV